jgi:hypothetical protein
MKSQKHVLEDNLCTYEVWPDASPPSHIPSESALPFPADTPLRRAPRPDQTPLITIYTAKGELQDNSAKGEMAYHVFE